MYILTIDVGTTVMKAYFFTGDGRCHWEDGRPLTLRREGGVVEMDAALATGALESLLESAGQWCEAEGIALSAMALTSQRSSVMAVDAAGHPLGSMMMWQSRCADDICREFEGVEEIRDICGMEPTSVFSAPKIVWLKRHRPEVYRAAHRLVGFYEWLLYHLTGRWLTDDTVASSSCLTSLKDGQWSPRLLQLFGIDAAKLCEILPVGSGLPLLPAVQHRLRQKRPLPVILAGGDQQCAAVGAGCLQAGDIQINTGTGGYVLGMLPLGHKRGEAGVRYNRSCLPPFLLAEVNLKHCCTAVDRQAAILYGSAPDAVERFSADALLGVDASPGFTIDPNAMGDRAAWDDAYARARLAEWVGQHGKTAVNLALLDGIIAALAKGVRLVRRCTGAAGQGPLACGGGLTRSAAFCQRLSSALHMPLRVPGMGNVTALGALVLALRALLPDEDAGDIWRQVHATWQDRIYMPK